MRHKIISLLLFAVFTVVVACTSPITDKTPSYKASAEYVVAENLMEMKQNSEIIVAGKFGKHISSYNAHRDVRNPNEESKESKSETKVYEFEVSKVLKGPQHTNLKVGIPYAEEISGLTDPNGDQFKATVQKAAYFEPETDDEYILFLKKNKYGDDYIAPFYPNVMKVEATKKVKLKIPTNKESTFTKDGTPYKIETEGLEHYDDQISGKSADEIIQQIQAE